MKPSVQLAKYTPSHPPINHRTRVDWNFMWSALLHNTYPASHNAKFVLKEDIKKVPGPGKFEYYL